MRRVRTSGDTFLLVGALCSALVALLHVACVFVGASWYRALGAGEKMARMAEAGHWYPTVVTLFIAVVFSVWSLYALSGAGVVRRLPLLRPLLCVITAIYLLRGVSGVLLRPYFPGNSSSFWFWSSITPLLIGAVHLIGVRQAWWKLGDRAE